MKLKKCIAASLCLALMGLSLITASYAANEVGFIHLNRLVNESEMGKTARKNLEKLRAGKTAALARKEKKFNELKLHIKNNSNKLTPGEKREKARELQTVSKEYKRLLADAKEDVARQDRELVAAILSKADGALKKVAKRKHFNIIFKDPNVVGYLNPHIDITDEVLKELDKMR